MYKVSVLVPIYNVEKYIERCVRSLFEQTYENLEYVFVDDCSPDHSVDILLSVLEEFPLRKEQVRLIRNKVNRGLAACRNIAIGNATGEFVCIVDSDDWLDHNSVELLVVEQQRTNADVVWGKMLMHTRDGIVELEEPLYRSKHDWVICYCRLTTGIVMTNCRRIIRRSLYERHDIKAAEGLNYSEDKLLMSQVAYYANSFSVIDNYIYHYNRQNPLSYTAKQKQTFNAEVFRQESGSIRLIEEFFSDKEDVYYNEIARARVRYLKGYLDQAIRFSSRNGFYMVVEQIIASNPKFLDEIGWNGWKKVIYRNYYYMKCFQKVKRKIEYITEKKIMRLIRYIKTLLLHNRNTMRILEQQKKQLSGMQVKLKQNNITFRTERLKTQVLSCKEMGITNERNCDEELIVSLTTFGKRINEVYLAIESIMQGSMKPNRIILWLAENEFKGKILPITLQLQQKRGLEIEYCEDIRSFKKIVPTMEKYPDACVVTIDDDVMYEFDLLENLVNAHIDNPNDVCACRIHRITLNENNTPKSYMQWQFLTWPKEKSNRNFLTSGGGTLFPPHCFVKEFFNKGSFLSLCPYADDVWINAMIWMSDRQITKVYTHSPKGCDYIETNLEQDYALSKENTNALNCRNDVQIKAVMDKYDLYHYLQETETL